MKEFLKKIKSNDTLKKIYILGMDLGYKNISSYAASTAFFFFLSLIPSVMLICAMIPYVPITQETFLEFVLGLAPENFKSFFVVIIEEVYRNAGSMIPISMLVTIWSAGKALLFLTRGLNAMLDIREKRNYFLLRGIACIFTLLLLVAIVLSLVIMVFGKSIIHMLEARSPKIHWFINWIYHFRPVLLFIIIALVLAFLFAYMPGKRTKIRVQLPGAVLASFGWNITAYFFSIYVTYYNGFRIYGSLTTIIVLLFWLYICMNLVLFGAYLNKYLMINKNMKTSGS